MRPQTILTSSQTRKREDELQSSPVGADLELCRRQWLTVLGAFSLPPVKEELNSRIEMEVYTLSCEVENLEL